MYLIVKWNHVVLWDAVINSSPIWQTKQNDALPFAKLFERWTNDAAALHHTVSAHPHIGQVASDNAVIHDNSLEHRTHSLNYITESRT